MKYPLVPLGEVLDLSLDEVPVEPSATYRMAGVYSFGRGLFAREPISGADTSYRKLTRIHGRQFVYSRLFAWEGAVAVVPPDFDGFFLSHEFPTFRIRESRVLPEYLDHVARWPVFHDSLAGSTRGLGLRRQRVHIEQLLDIRIPLPELDDQHRIAARLDKLSSRLNRARKLLGTAQRLADALMSAAVPRDSRSMKVAEVVEKIERKQLVVPTERYRLLGTKWYSGGLFVKDEKPGTDISATRLFEVRTHDFVYNRLFAWKGSFALVAEAHDGCMVSGEFPTFRVDRALAEPEYIMAVFRRPCMWSRALNLSRGSTPTSRNRLKEEQFLTMDIPVPSLGEQRRVIGLVEKLSNVTRKQEQQLATMQALELSTLNRSLDGSLVP